MEAPVFELCTYTLNPKDYHTVVEKVNETETFCQYSELFGFWTSNIGGDQGPRLVHIWEYESIKTRHESVTITKEERWKNEVIDPILPCVRKWDVSLLTPTPESTINKDFGRLEEAVYVLDEVEVESYREVIDLKVSSEEFENEILVGRFCGIMGRCKTEYRLWRYCNIKEATEAVWKRRVEDTPFDGLTTLLQPADSSPLH